MKGIRKVGFDNMKFMTNGTLSGFGKDMLMLRLGEQRQKLSAAIFNTMGAVERQTVFGPKCERLKSAIGKTAGFTNVGSTVDAKSDSCVVVYPG